MTAVAKLKHKSASLKLIVWDEGHATIAAVRSKRQGKGHASALLREVINLCDALRVPTILVQAHADRPDKPGLNDQQLRAFYEKFGFEVVNFKEPVTLERKFQPTK